MAIAIFNGKVSRSGSVLGTVLLGLVLVACGSPSASSSSRTAAVVASGGGVTVDVVTTAAPWQGGFPGAVRIVNTAAPSPISSFEVVFKISGGSPIGAAWNGTITGPDASGNFTAVGPSWLQFQPIGTGQTWDVGFNGSGTLSSSTIVSLKINGQVVPLGNGTDNPPTVALASSASTVTAAGSITLTATASDDNGVSKVEFYEGTTLLGSDTTAPYTASVAFTAANNGTHSYTARAYDTANQTTDSAAVAVVVNIGTVDAPPTVSLASSAATVTAAGSITLTATAADDRGVSRVEFYEGTTLLASDTTAPYTTSISFTSANNGTHSYTARAYDTANQTANSAAVAVVVNIGTVDAPPTVSLASSATTVTAAGSITLTATAADDRGVSKVEFYEGTTLLASDATAPYTTSIAFTSANNGSHTYTARAYDTANQTANSAGVTVTVNIGGTGGSISINAGGAATGTFVADQYFSGGTTYSNNVSIDLSQIPTNPPPAAVFNSERYGPFTYTIPNRTAGASYSVTLYFVESYVSAAGQRTFSVAINGTNVLSAFDIFAAAGGRNRAIARTFTAVANASGQIAIQFTAGVQNPKVNGISVVAASSDLPPTVALSSSATTVTTASTVTLTATASDDRGVARVEFYEGTTLLGSDTTAPYTFPISFTSANNGTHTYTARAYDTANQTASSAGVTVTVNIGGADLPPTVSLASSATTVTAAGSITLTATATDDRGVARVEFYEGTTLLGSDTTSPYTFPISFTSANNGSHTYTARAYDTANQTANSAGVTVTVNIGTTDRPPTVTLASSATTVTTASSITLTATATDDRGISKVEFYEGTLLLSTVVSSPMTHTIAYTQAANGTHTYTARAYDTANQTANSAAVTVTVAIQGNNTGYELDPPDVCYAQYWNQGCDGAAPTCGGRCQTANACSPPEDPQKSRFPLTFACPRFIAFSDEMVQAAKDDWGDPAPFVYGVVGHDADAGGLDTGTSSCCQCYQLIFERPEPGSPQPPDLPIPKPMIVQSFNTAAGGGKNFDIYMGAGGFGAFNACVPGTYSGTATTTFGSFMYTAFPSEYPGQGGIKAMNIPECKVNGTVTVASMQSAACQSKITSLCNNTASTSAAMATTTKTSCIETNRVDGFIHQNWQIRAKRVECPVALTRVTGCRLAPQGLPAANPNAKTPATADGTFRTGYTTTTMQDCCKPSCAWKDQVTGAGLVAVDKWTSFYSCDKNGVPITAP